jgi:hypothetical protein
MICGSIYKIIFPNGKHYIGLTTTSLKQRQTEHNNRAKHGDAKYLYNALRKYNMINNFELIEIDTADTLEELCKKEIYHIVAYNSYYMNGNGYNMTYGGEGTHGYIFTEEDKEKMSESHIKRFENIDAREKCSKGQKKRFENPEEIKKLIERTNKHYEEHPETIEKIKESLKIHYEEHPEKIENCSERMKKYYEENPELKDTFKERMKKYFEEHPEIRKGHSAKMKKYFENPESKKENGAKIKKYYEEHPETKEHLSNIKKKYYEEHPEIKNNLKERMKKRFEEHPELKKEHNDKIKKYFENPESKRKILNTKGQNKPFDIFKTDGTFIKTFNYHFEAKEYLRQEHNINSTINITVVLSGKRKSCAGFVFKYHPLTL